MPLEDVNNGIIGGKRMNPEILLTHLGGIKLLIVVLIAWIYSRAGRGKIWGKRIRRRVVCPLILLLAMLIFSLMGKLFNIKLLGVLGVSFLMYYGTLSVGYGAGSWLRSVVGRIPQQFIVGALQGGSCVLIAIYSGAWGLFSLSAIVPCLTLGFLGGVFDSDTHAAWKEILVGMSIFLFPIFMI
jgi:hypothetical protein